MKSVKDVAEEVGISTQALYKKINKTMKIELDSHITIVDGQKCIDDKGVEIIKTSLQSVANTLSNENSVDSEFYKKQIELLQTELQTEREYSRRQSDKISELADKLAQLTENGQVLLREQNLKSLPSPAPEKVSLWDRIFKRKGGD